ncbi:MAG TPA: hypothetical protein VD999_04565 [Vitreimonas sp.]|nr:hypothetical protein [Vitreimonas sp.]
MKEKVSLIKVRDHLVAAEVYKHTATATAGLNTFRRNHLKPHEGPESFIWDSPKQLLLIGEQGRIYLEDLITEGDPVTCSIASALLLLAETAEISLIEKQKYTAGITVREGATRCGVENPLSEAATLLFLKDLFRKEPIPTRNLNRLGLEHLSMLGKYLSWVFSEYNKWPVNFHECTLAILKLRYENGASMTHKEIAQKMNNGMADHTIGQILKKTKLNMRQMPIREPLIDYLLFPEK